MNGDAAAGAKGWGNRDALLILAAAGLCVLLSACASGSARIN